MKPLFIVLLHEKVYEVDEHSFMSVWRTGHMVNVVQWVLIHGTERENIKFVNLDDQL